MSGIDWKPIEYHLTSINKEFVNVEKNEARIFTEHFDKVYKHVTDSMGKADDLFQKVFRRQQLAGSYADRIKVGQADEYDALMVLDFPEPVVNKTKPGLVTINIKDGITKRWSSVPEKNYKKLIDESGYLLQDKVLIWIRDLIYNIVKSRGNLLRIDSNEYSVAAESNGPAITLDITVKKCASGSSGKFSIDFVTALAFDFQKIWFADFTPPIIRSKNWNAIAKPRKADNKTVINQNRDWTCSYADMEREYLKDTNTLKQLIRFFKKIRDTHNLTNLKSYYIKVIFLHQRKKKITELGYWKQPLGTLFPEMFDIMLTHLKERKLLSFWHKDYNLFGELSQVQSDDIYNKLKSIKEKIEKNLADKRPKFIISVILQKDELKSLKQDGPAQHCTTTVKEVPPSNSNTISMNRAKGNSKVSDSCSIM